jgi:hypothetical protein
MNLKAKLSLSALTLSLLGLAMAAPASASYAIGQLDPPSVSGVCGPVALVQTGVEAGTASYAIPAGDSGVITAWRTQTEAAGEAGLVVLRPTGTENQFEVVANDGPHQVAAASKAEFGGLRIPVRPGDAIGLFSHGTNCVSSLPGPFTISVFPVGLNPPAGATINATGFGSQLAAEVEATVEIDRDGDGFGDDTQDLCPNEPAAQTVPCVAPAGNTPRPPRLALHGHSAQRALKQGGVVELASSDRPATLRATGSVSIAGAKRPLTLRSVAASAAVGADTRLVLRFTAGEKRRVAAALRRGKRVRARVEVTAEAGGAGSTASQRISINTTRKEK